MGCHFLLQCMKVKSESEVAQSCPTLVTPWTAAYQALPSMGFSRQEYRKRVGCHCILPYLFTSLPKSLTSSHLWDANDHPPLPGHRGEKTLTTGGPGKEQGTNKLPPTRILQRSTRGQPEMGDCSPEVLAFFPGSPRLNYRLKQRCISQPGLENQCSCEWPACHSHIT